MILLDFPILGEQHFRQFHQRLSRALAQCEAGVARTFEEESTAVGVFFTLRLTSSETLEVMVAYKDKAVLASFLRFLRVSIRPSDAARISKKLGKNAEYWTLHWPSQPRTLEPFSRAYELFLRETN